MTLVQIIPIVAILCVLAFMLRIVSASNPNATSMIRGNWQFTAALSAAFLAFSILTIAQEGVAAVWQNHTQNFWGNQVWIDLIISLGIGWWVLLPKARSLGMNDALWVALIVASGGIGLLAMLARIQYLSQKTVVQS